MNEERWRKAKAIYQSLVERDSSQKDAYLAQACAGDETLRKEVESLIACQSEADGLMASPALEVVVRELASEPEEDLSGRALLHYRVKEKIGAGGMGIVYRAGDTRLNREVAIKALPAIFSADPERLARFEREARLLATLSHPNVAAIYGLEECEGKRYIVMELAAGQTLAERIAKGPLPIEEALEICRQIAEGLEAAHEKGIVHRDLKPANVKITPEGKVKILDFGLAKAFEQETPAVDASKSPTLTDRMTRSGVILGTAAYMAPEQAQGKTVDKRADIWTFGCILYECLTGRHPFDGDTVTETLASILKGEPDWRILPAALQPRTNELLHRCLDKDSKRRLRDIGEARLVIETSLSDKAPHSNAARAPRGDRRLWLAWSAAIASALLAVSLIPVALKHLSEKPPAPETQLRFQIMPPAGSTNSVLSPDGRKLLFYGGGRIRVHFLESGETRDLTAAGAQVPAWSPDSRFIAYVLGGNLMKIEATGGSPKIVLTNVKGWGLCAWNRDDVIIVAQSKTGIFRVPASGGVPIQITAVDTAHQELWQYGPCFLPDGRHFVYGRAYSNGSGDIALGSLDAKPEQQNSKPLMASNSQAVYTPSTDPAIGYLLFDRGGTLMAQRIDNNRLKLIGQASTVVDVVPDEEGTGWTDFSASANGVLMFLLPPPIPERQITRYDRAGNVLGTFGESANYQGLALSPDGTRLAVSKITEKTANIYLMDLSGDGTSRRFTFGAARDKDPVWSPDGNTIVFSSNRDGHYDLYQKPVSGIKNEEALLKTPEDKQATSWSQDGAFLLYSVVHNTSIDDIWVLLMDRDRKSIPFLINQPELGLRKARFSPDGHWVAYRARPGLYVRSFFMNSAASAVETGGIWEILNRGGGDPHWRGDGRELYYCSNKGQLMAVDIARGPTFRSGKPQAVAPTSDPQGPFESNLWDASADGRFFIAAAPIDKNNRMQYTVVMNWQSALKK